MIIILEAFFWSSWWILVLWRLKGSKHTKSSFFLLKQSYRKWQVFPGLKWYFLSWPCQRWRKIQLKYQVCPSVLNYSIDQILSLLIHLNLTKSNFPIWIIGNFSTKCHQFIITLFPRPFGDQISIWNNLFSQWHGMSEARLSFRLLMAVNYSGNKSSI